MNNNKNSNQPSTQGVTSLLSGIAIGAVVTVLAVVAIVPPDAAPTEQVAASDGFGAGGVPDTEDEFVADDSLTDEEGVVGSGPSVGAEGASQDGGESGASVGGRNSNPPPGSGPGAPGSAQCARGQNGGATDVGVTAESIKLGATVVESGFAEAFLGEVPHALEAVRKKVNRDGGICGRLLELVKKNDEWKADVGAGALATLVQQEKVFAFAVAPSSEGLNQASRQGLFRKHKIPVVGADGLNNTQFTDPYIWPVAAATTTQVHVMVKNAWDRCNAVPECKEVGLQPAIVFGNTYRFGVEGAFAFNAAYKDLAGKDIPGYSGGNTGCQGGQGGQGERYCGISNDPASYETQVSIINDACNRPPRCNFLLLLLEPTTALKWMVRTPDSPRPDSIGVGGNSGRCCGTAGAQPLFTRDFAKECGEECDGLWVWTGYNPPIEQYAASRYAPNREYVSDLKAQCGSCDEFSQFTQGGYVGMRLLVAALETVGPNLTRERLAQTLNSMPPFDIGLTKPLKWTASQRYANHSAQAYRIPAKGGWTGGWEPVEGYVRDDKWLGEHNGA